MKILFLLHTLTSGGAERVTSTLANHFAAGGHDVSIVTMGAGDDFYPLDRRVMRHRLSLSSPSTSLFSAVTRGLRRLATVRGLLRTEKPEIAIAMMASWNVELALATFGLPVRTVGSERIHPPTLPLHPVWRFLRRHVYGLLDIVVAQTELSRQWLEANTSARDVRVIPNPVPMLGSAATATVVGLPKDAPVLLGVGRLVEQKRFDRVIDAMAAWPETFGAWHLVLVGTGPLETDLKRRVSRAGLDKRVHFPGTTRAIEGWYRRAQMFVLSSDFEGFPNALLEAMACGLAVVATDCDTGPRDLVVNGQNGLLVPKGDQEALNFALLRLAGDGVLRATLGNAAQSVSVTYSADAISAKWITLISPRRIEIVR